MFELRATSTDRQVGRPTPLSKDKTTYFWQVKQSCHSTE